MRASRSRSGVRKEPYTLGRREGLQIRSNLPLNNLEMLFVGTVRQRSASVRTTPQASGVYSLSDVPTIARLGPYRFFFFSGDRREPRHVHVERDDMLAKFWLAGPSLAESRGFPAHELRTITPLVAKHRDKFAEAWDERFGS